MTINAATKIAAILKQDARALEAIVSISPAFEKLRNPLLRKLMAGRTSLATAARIGRCGVEDFYQKLERLGFTVDRKTEEKGEEVNAVPSFLASVPDGQLIVLDVRPALAAGSDPLSTILETLKTLQPGQVLKILNTFEPTPLISLLAKKGWQSFVRLVNANLVETFFYNKTAAQNLTEETTVAPATSDWQQVLQSFSNRLLKLDVRQLEMPQPMLAILESLDRLPGDTALYVFHKRIPVFLLPELAQRGFDYRLNERTAGDVHLLIYKK
ncbi:MAG TPA: DUF2249 domain-containing protein [Flavisolibacter sp.]|nr:DUF2249 domain-containing protein [Flavisolibacter sp.]